jgi:hypothetical protein
MNWSMRDVVLSLVCSAWLFVSMPIISWVADRIMCWLRK